MAPAVNSEIKQSMKKAKRITMGKALTTAPAIKEPLTKSIIYSQDKPPLSWTWRECREWSYSHQQNIRANEAEFLFRLLE
jgi:hypothetical protein